MIDVPPDYRPNRALHPGRFLKDQLAHFGMSQRELAERMERPPQVINQITREKKSITPETALGIEKVLGIDAQFWINLQAVHDLVVARMEEDEKLELQRHWLKKIPDRKIAEFGWIERHDRVSERLRELLKFFGTPSLESLQPTTEVVGFRITEKAKVNEWALRAWLRRGEIEAREVEVAGYDEQRFRDAVKEIRSLTLEDPSEYWSKMRGLCAAAGVVLLGVPHLPKTGANGVTRWLSPKVAIIQLNLRYGTADIFWFTFFHEAGHVLQHETKRTFVDLKGEERRNPDEDEADAFARESLITRDEWEPFVTNGDFSSSSIRSFASSQELHPGIVVGRLQREGQLPYNQRNTLKQRLKFVGVAS
ncbi:MAG: HigA family addiction module antitoxin [Chloroflexi bacterium]|nr:HigA family addiction module antitoxin [Chloroflexota bacterium]